MGAAGRDFHNFNCLFRDNARLRGGGLHRHPDPGHRGPGLPAGARRFALPATGIPIHAEAELEKIVTRARRRRGVVLLLRRVRTRTSWTRASQVIGWGAQLRRLLRRSSTMIPSTKPVIAIVAVRTGVGKSQTTRYVSSILKAMGKKVVAIRHPMPYGDLAKQACQRFETYEDLDRHECTIEEREEYEPHIDNGFVVYAGVDYERILREAEKEADVILWDGGNNDTPFYKPDLHITLVDPHRPGHELTYYPGETNLLMADLLIVNKVAHRRPGQGRAGASTTAAPYNPGRADHQVRLEDHGRQAGADRRQARPGRRGRPDADPRRDDLRRRLVCRQERRRLGDRRPQAVRRRYHRRRPTRSTPTPARSCRPWVTATSRSPTSRRPSTPPRRRRGRGHADRPVAHPQGQQAASPTSPTSSRRSSPA